MRITQVEMFRHAQQSTLLAGILQAKPAIGGSVTFSVVLLLTPFPRTSLCAFRRPLKRRQLRPWHYDEVDGPRIENARIAVPPGPGLGITIADDYFGEPVSSWS